MGRKSGILGNGQLGPFSGRNKCYQKDLASRNNEITILHHRQSLPSIFVRNICLTWIVNINTVPYPGGLSLPSSVLGPDRSLARTSLLFAEIGRNYRREGVSMVTKARIPHGAVEVNNHSYHAPPVHKELPH